MKHIPWQAIFFTLLFCGLLAWMLAKADAAPPPDASGELAPWFDSLKQPGTGIGCCGHETDCRTVKERVVGDHYEVWIDRRFPRHEGEGEWVSVSADRILERQDNPTGSPVACWIPSMGVFCFVRSAET